MDNATLIAGLSIVLNLAVGLIGYLMRDKLETTTKALDEAKADIVDIKVNYVHKNEYQVMRKEILDAIERLDSKLDRVK